jgi:hypothetical protein
VAALNWTAETYRRAVWDRMPVRVEIWSEKDAIAGILVDVTGRWDVPLMVVRGYSSLTYLYTAAEEAKAVGKPIHIYYFGDHDPSGLDIERFIQRELRGFSGAAAELHFERVAVTREQIIRLGLPTRPTKTTDSRSKGFGGDSVEVDALSPRMLRELTERCIRRHVEPRELAQITAIEREEREMLKSIADQVAEWGVAS